MQTVRHPGWVGMLALFLFALIGGGVFVASRTPSPLSVFQHARRITALETDAYLWRTPDLLLFYRQRPGTRGGLNRDVMQLDCRTGMSGPLPRLNSDPEIKYMGLLQDSLSPDGRWLLMNESEEPDVTYKAEALIGSQRMVSVYHGKVISSHVSNALWYPDSCRWVSLCVGEPGWVQSTTIPFLQVPHRNIENLSCN